MASPLLTGPCFLTGPIRALAVPASAASLSQIVLMGDSQGLLNTEDLQNDALGINFLYQRLSSLPMTSIIAHGLLVVGSK